MTQEPTWRSSQWPNLGEPKEKGIITAMDSNSQNTVSIYEPQWLKQLNKYMRESDPSFLQQNSS